MAVFLQRAAAERPIVLALDDLHRADPASLRLLAFVVRQLQHARILIFCVLRPEIPEAPETQQLLEELKSASRCIALSGLVQRDIARYVQLATGIEPPAQVCEQLQEQTAGNPLFLQHLVENWRVRMDADGAPNFKLLTAAPLSAGVSGATEGHLELVSQPCRELLRAAAVLGTEFSAGVLMRVAEHDAQSCSAQLAEAAQSGLVRAVPSDHPGRYRFTHVLVRDALYAQLVAAKRTELHSRAAQAFAAQGIGDNGVLLAEVTRHSVQAAELDPERALHYTMRAAELALRTLAYEQAAAHYDCALALLQYRAPDPKLRMSLLFRKGDALARIDLPAARTVLFEAAALASELGDADHMVRSAMLIASRPESGVVDAPQVEVLRRALGMLDAQDRQDERYALLEALLAKSLLYELGTEERPVLARSALVRARSLRGAAQRAEVLTRCHEALPGPEHQQERLDIATELMSLAISTDDAVSMLNAYAAHVETCVERGDVDGVDNAVESIDVLAGRVREPFYRWYSKVIRNMRDFVRGDIASCERGIQEAWQHSGAVSAEFAQHTYRVQRYAILRMRGQLKEAEQITREMMLSFPAVPGWGAAWGAIVWDLGQHDEARACLQRMMSRGALHIRGKPSGLANCAALSELCCKVQDQAASQEVYDILAPFAEYQGFTTMGGATYGPLERHLGTLAESLGQAQLAEKHYRAALTASSRMRSPVFIGGTSYSYARMLLLAGEPNRRAAAAELLSNAWQLADRHQLHSINVIAKRLAARHGIRLSTPPISNGNGA
jgi:tetratricopeptide (TPR) repeat protein